MRATAACSSPAYQEVVSITMTTSIPRFTVNWWTGPAGSSAGSIGPGGGSSAMPEMTATAVPPPPADTAAHGILSAMRALVTVGAHDIGRVMAKTLQTRDHGGGG